MVCDVLQHLRGYLLNILLCRIQIRRDGAFRRRYNPLDFQLFVWGRCPAARVGGKGASLVTRFVYHEYHDNLGRLPDSLYLTRFRWSR